MITIPEIMQDDKVIAKNVRMNISLKERGGRIKLDILDGDKQTPVDLLLLFNDATLAKEVELREKISGKYFKFKVGINLRRKLYVKGLFAGRNVDQEIGSLSDMITLIKSAL